MADMEKYKRQMLSNPNDRRHGTIYGYACGCRCEKCKAAIRKHRAETGYQSQSKAQKRYDEKRRTKLFADETDPLHGTYYGYCLGCRCDKCRAANTEHAREYRFRKNNERKS